jgi:hypothetical protein
MNDNPAALERPRGLHLFARLLRLYPRGFRQEFGEEMLEVFADAMAEASPRGLLAVALRFVRELWGLLAGAVRERLRMPQSVPPLPRGLALRGAIGFGLGSAPVVLSSRLIASRLGSPMPPAGGLVLRCLFYAFLGLVVTFALGLWTRERRAAYRRPILFVVVGSAVGEGLSWLYDLAVGSPRWNSLSQFLRGSPGMVIMVHSLLATPGAALAGLAIAAALGAVRSSLRATVRLALFGALSFAGLIFAYWELTWLVWPRIAQATPAQMGAAVSSIAVGTKAICGAILGWALGRSTRRRGVLPAS